MDSICFFEDTDTGSPRSIGPFDLAADLATYGETPAPVLLSPCDAQYLLAVVDYLKEKEVWQPDDDWAAVITYVEELEARLREPVSWFDLFASFLDETTVSLSVNIPLVVGSVQVILSPLGVDVAYIRE
jgi:hypothetical protein